MDLVTCMVQLHGVAADYVDKTVDLCVGNRINCFTADGAFVASVIRILAPLCIMLCPADRRRQWSSSWKDVALMCQRWPR